jgi:hypothetical protein
MLNPPAGGQVVELALNLASCNLHPDTMTELQRRLKTLLQAADVWLDPDNGYLKKAIDKTVDECYFSAADVQFALKALRRSLSEKALAKWAKRSSLTDGNDARSQNILCLHAGNIPLVGFQDALAVLLSGARYTGKISRKDPYLLPSFLNEVKKTKIWGAVNVQWSHRLDDFEDMHNDAVLFAGSGQSVPGVREALNRLNLIQHNTHFLIRTAHFSLAYLNDPISENIENLTEAILRYGGQGCRSVAVVVSPASLDSIKGKLSKSAQAFLEDNPQYKQPPPSLRQQYAYNEAVGRSQIWLHDFLLQEGGLNDMQDFTCCWIEGDEQKAAMLANQYGGQLQSVYVVNQESALSEYEREIELLSDAQQPPIYWKPDGINTLKWLARRSA